ncbi:Rhodanese-like protein [Schizopora paradoxa]|uniref:Rhodanese-like protein n=1 Tax=Schizopora paradoxa TaxID=27342 RepID=A0A0H2R9X9_9AGAM|nr:Rhodanese-like protein [Schizopora paradoxa]
MQPLYRYINGDDLSRLIKSEKKPHEDYVVVDVRDDDYVGGNIANSVNHPSYTFEDNVNRLVEKTKKVSMVIFHCALSQQRGPKAARIYAEARKAAEKEGVESEYEVLVLRGGFTEFQTKFKNDALLVENYDEEIWSNGYF